MFELTGDQKKAQDRILAWLKARDAAALTLGGYAGTGKTTVIARTLKIFARTKFRTAFCCFTGKASEVLGKKLAAEEALFAQDYCGTIHGLIYSPVTEPDEEGEEAVLRWERKPSLDYDLIVVDEASMVSEDLWSDLRAYNIPILAVGDHGQLPPIHGRESIMTAPDILLENIHRQAEDNPIIKLSVLARETGRIPPGRYGDGVLKTDDPESVWHFSSPGRVMFLCGYNNTRVALNRAVREKLGEHAKGPRPGERVICLRNAREKKIHNGGLGTLLDIKERGEHHYDAEILMDSQVKFKGALCRAQFGARYPLDRDNPAYRAQKNGYLFDWGYALTVHKAQGSEAERVVLIEERLPSMTDEDWRRWLYTGVTRAVSQLVIIGAEP
ncbi:MAG TPA: AAA family ATPase [Elusimicrobiota bacterium]|nr:AAA family ATPase [Elusimicrobiota bacterium]